MRELAANNFINVTISNDCIHPGAQIFKEVIFLAISYIALLRLKPRARRMTLRGVRPPAPAPGLGVWG